MPKHLVQFSSDVFAVKLRQRIVVFLGVHDDNLRQSPSVMVTTVNTAPASFKLKFHGSSFLVASSRGCPQQVARVGLVEFGEQHDTWTNRQHYRLQ